MMKDMKNILMLERIGNNRSNYTIQIISIILKELMIVFMKKQLRMYGQNILTSFIIGMEALIIEDN